MEPNPGTSTKRTKIMFRGQPLSRFYLQYQLMGLPGDFKFTKKLWTFINARVYTWNQTLQEMKNMSNFSTGYYSKINNNNIIIFHLCFTCLHVLLYHFNIQLLQTTIIKLHKIYKYSQRFIASFPSRQPPKTLQTTSKKLKHICIPNRNPSSSEFGAVTIIRPLKGAIN